MNFGTRLSEERKRIGLNQTEFAKIGGITKTSQVNYESGDRSPNVDYWQAISAAGADVQYILTGVRSSLTSEGKALEEKHDTKPSSALDAKRLTLAIETVEEGLEVTHRAMNPDKKALLIMAVYDLFKTQAKNDKQAVLSLVQSIAA